MDGNWNAGWNGNFGLSLGRNQRYSLNFYGTVNYTNSVDLNTTTETAANALMSDVHTWNFSFQPNLYFGVAEFLSGFTYVGVDHKRITGTRSDFTPFNTTNYKCGVFFNFNLPLDFYLFTSIFAEKRTGFSDPSLNNTRISWDMSISRSIWGEKPRLSFLIPSLYDLYNSKRIIIFAPRKALTHRAWKLRRNVMTNPFIISGSIPAKYFCDRREESAKLIRTLTNEGNLCLISPRRMGKSQLIHFCYEKPELATDYYLFFVDILHTSGIKEFTYAFGQKVFNVLHSKSRKMFDNFVQGLKSVNGKFGFDPVAGTPTFELELGDIKKPEFTLGEIFDCLEEADKPCIVAFDEFQQINRYPEKNIEALLRSHIQRLRNVHFIFSGSEQHLIAEMFLSSARPFYNSVSIMELHPLATTEYFPFVCRLFAEQGKHIKADNVQRVYNLFEGNTYYMQRTFHEAILNTATDGECTLDILRFTIDSLLNEEGDAYRLLLSRIPERQKELLYAVAAEGKAQQIMGTKFIKRYALASSSAVQAAARKLIELDLLTVADGIYSVPNVLFRLYLQRIKTPGAIFLD